MSYQDIDTSSVVRLRSPSCHSPDTFIVPFLQRSRPELLTRAACRGLEPAAARRLRRALLHHSCSFQMRFTPTSDSSLLFSTAHFRPSKEQPCMRLHRPLGPGC